MSGTPNWIREMIERWIAELPPKTRKSAKSDLNTALTAIDGDVLERARNNPTDLLTELDDYLRMRRFAGTTRNKIKSVFRRFLRFHGIETLPPIAYTRVFEVVRRSSHPHDALSSIV